MPISIHSITDNHLQKSSEKKTLAIVTGKLLDDNARVLTDSKT